jgi:hypothetical protein
MPFTIETEVKDSPIHGKGLFALEPIAKGGVVWTFHGQHKHVQGYCHDGQTIDNKVWDKTSLTALYSRNEAAVKKIFFYGYVHPPSVSELLNFMCSSLFDIYLLCIHDSLSQFVCFAAIICGTQGWCKLH